MGAKYFLLWLSTRFGKKRFQITNISEKTGTISINFYLTNLYLWIIIKTQHKMLFFTFPIGNWYLTIRAIKFCRLYPLYLSHRELILWWISFCQSSHIHFTFPIGNWYTNFIKYIVTHTNFTFPIGNWYSKSPRFL